MNHIKKISIIAVVLIAVGVIGTAISYRFTDTSAQFEEKTIDPESISTINIHADNADIEVKPNANGSEIQVELVSSKNWKGDLNVELNGDDLTIETQEGNKFFNIDIFNQTPKLYVHLPEKEFQTLQIRSVNGRLDVHHVTAAELRAETDNGRINLSAVSADDVYVSSVNGKINLNGVEGDIQGETDNGALYLKTTTIHRQIHMESINGKIEIESDEKPTNVLYDVRTTNGKVRIFGSSDWDIKVGDGDHQIKLTTVNGNIEVH